MADWVRRASEWIGLGPRESDRYEEWDDEDTGEDRAEERVLGTDDPGDADPERTPYVDEAYAEDRGGREATEVTELVPARGAAPARAAAPARTPEPARPPERIRADEPREADINRIIFITPKTYNEARSIGENFRDGFPVIINLGFMEHDHARRVVDFASGLIFGLNGSMEKVDKGVFLLSPHNVHVTTEDKQRIADGFYNQS